MKNEEQINTQGSLNSTLDESEETALLVIDNLKAELIQAKHGAEKCENELTREREINNHLMIKKSALDLLAQEIASLKSDKQELAANVTELHVENSRLKTYVTFLSEKIYSLQTDLTKANEEKEKAEKEPRQIKEKNKEQLDLLNEKDQLIKELNLRISQLDKENKEAAIESERKLRAAEKDKKELQKILNEQQEQQKRDNDQTALQNGFKGQHNKQFMSIINNKKWKRRN